MSSIEALKEQARRHEQNEEWAPARDLYIKAINRLADESQPDIGLHNRVGDILVKLGDYEGAVEHFMRATDLYVEAELPNNAIAVCKKVARHLPNRTEIYLRMGQIRAGQGFMVDARENFLTYAAKVEEAGDVDEALRALVEFAELAPDDTDLRMSVGAQLQKHQRPEEALVQFAEGYRILSARGENEAAEAFAQRIRELDADADLDALMGPAGGLGFEAAPLAGGHGDDGFGASFGEVDLEGHGGAGSPVSEEEDEPEELEVEFGEIVVDSGSEEDSPAPQTTASADGPSEETSVFEAIGLDDEDGEPGRPAVEAVRDEPDEEAFDHLEVEADLPFISFGGEEEDDETDDDDLPMLAVDLDDDEPEDAAAVASASGQVGTAGVDGVDGSTSSARSDWRGLREAYDRGRPDPARAEHMVEIAFQSNDPAILVESYELLAEALDAVGDADRARSVWEQILALAPGHAGAAAALGAAGPAETGRSRDPAPAGGFVDLGSMIFGDDGEGERTTRFQVAYEEPSGDEEADFAKMLDQFKAKVAENFDASDVKAHHDLGTAYKEMGLLDEAVSEFQQALRASGTHLPTYELLGQTFMDRGEHAAAVRVLERALKIPSDVEDELIGIYYYLGRAHEELGQTSEAVGFYDRVFALDINFADVTARLRELR